MNRFRNFGLKKMVKSFIVIIYSTVIPKTPFYPVGGNLRLNNLSIVEENMMELFLAADSQQVIYWTIIRLSDRK